MPGLQSLGVKVPRDVSVFGWDHYELGLLLPAGPHPVAVDRERQGREAVRRLLAVLRGEPSSGRWRRPSVGTAAGRTPVRRPNPRTRSSGVRFRARSDVSCP
ncbi:substrate-binding domain-containing protein [Streptomyces himalayensis]|uniref:substrate-binding domain-containing protein n=1 Tax=Streptomyces himalayensis TaxID=2820085 RepID=UPI0035E435B1